MGSLETGTTIIEDNGTTEGKFFLYSTKVQLQSKSCIELPRSSAAQY
jgi:hypothetical protein